MRKNKLYGSRRCYCSHSNSRWSSNCSAPVTAIGFGPAIAADPVTALEFGPAIGFGPAIAADPVTALEFGPAIGSGPAIAADPVTGWSRRLLIPICPVPALGL